MLTTEKLSKDFGGFAAVSDVDLDVREGEIHGLIGPNGAGKTTTFNLISGELEPTSGAVRFRDENITGAPPERIARLGVGRSFQIIQYFPEMTVREHFRLAVRDSTKTLSSVFQDSSEYDATIEEYASRVQLEDRLDTVAKHLSHGEKRYLDIGLVLGLEPDLILFDEPAAGLNKSETNVLERIIEDLRGEYTILFIEHDINLVQRLADRITVLHRGEVLVRGPPEEISKDERLKEVYLGE